eukprot:9256713-Lingulodinium_polyedra.AAC.1
MVSTDSPWSNRSVAPPRLKECVVKSFAGMAKAIETRANQRLTREYEKAKMRSLAGTGPVTARNDRTHATAKSSVMHTRCSMP